MTRSMVATSLGMLIFFCMCFGVSADSSFAQESKLGDGQKAQQGDRPSQGRADRQPPGRQQQQGRSRPGQQGNMQRGVRGGMQRGARGGMQRGRGGEDHSLVVGEIAPDFHLNALEGDEKTQLSSFKGKKPVILFFGSYT